MRGARSEAAFTGVVLLAEVCARLGIPWSLTVFSRWSRVVRPLSASLSQEERQRLSRERFRVGPSGTNLERALDTQAAHMALWPQRQRLLVVVSDGEVDAPVCRTAVARVRGQGIAVVGLGLGRRTGHLIDAIPDAAVGIDCRDLPQVLGDLVARAFAGVGAS